MVQEPLQQRLINNKMLPKYKRILYKISGEVLMGDGNFGYDFNKMLQIATDIKNVVESGIEICLVVGGGNICRGSVISSIGMERAVGDYMGMLATVMNAIAMQNIMERNLGMETRVLSALQIKPICEPYIRRRALRHLERSRVVIFAAGTGNPFFTTDTGSVLRAVEMHCDAVLKGTSVDGVYSADPKTNKDAKRYDTISYSDVLIQNLHFMDQAAISLARTHSMPLVIFSIKSAENPLADLLSGKTVCTLVSEGS